MIATRANVLYVELPTSSIDTVEVLCAVRSSDAIRIAYDYRRNGWVISQAPESLDWREVAFIDENGRRGTGEP